MLLLQCVNILYANVMKLSTFASNRTSFPTCAEGTTTNQMALGGRSPSVLIIREYFYRLCELYTNLNLPPETALSLFRESLPLVMQALQNSTGGTSSLSSRTISAPPVIERAKKKMPEQFPVPSPNGGLFPSEDSSNPLFPSPATPSDDSAAGAYDQ